MKFMWNGLVIECFYPQRGVRQGDSISPASYVLTMECLSH